MTEPIAADDVCEHHYETRILGGRPISVRACVFCRTPDWADLDEQAAELYRWGWQEGRDGKAARETLSAYDRPREEARTTPDNPATSSDTADNSLRERLAEALRGVLACLYSLERVGGSLIGYQTVNVIPPADYDRWQAVLQQAALDGKEQQ